MITVKVLCRRKYVFIGLFMRQSVGAMILWWAPWIHNPEVLNLTSAINRIQNAIPLCWHIVCVSVGFFVYSVSAWIDVMMCWCKCNMESVNHENCVFDRNFVQDLSWSSWETGMWFSWLVVYVFPESTVHEPRSATNDRKYLVLSRTAIYNRPTCSILLHVRTRQPFTSLAPLFHALLLPLLFSSWYRLTCFSYTRMLAVIIKSILFI